MAMQVATHVGAAHAGAPPKRPRDIRLDFFRGLCLYIIFIAHMYGNPWADWIPARFGFSDATEIFVFCSGMASAIAFASAFERHGWLIGLGRVSYRVWQVYWAHISMFVLAIALTIVTDQLITGGGGAYLKGLQFDLLFGAHAKDALLGIVTLTWVPAYFDILPMYMVILCILPVFVAIARVNFPLAYGLSVAVWIGAQLGWFYVPKPDWSYGSWFFNPFGWQLVFFTGFSLMKGWLPAPPRDRRLVWLAAAYLAFSLPLEWEPALLTFETLKQTREALLPLMDKGLEGPLRILHFFALAYLAYLAVGEEGRHLRHRMLAPIVKVVAKTGTQSLGVFMSGMILSHICGPFLNVVGRNFFTVTMVNAGGIALLIAIAYLVSWYKAAPWSRPSMKHATPISLGHPAEAARR